MRWSQEGVRGGAAGAPTHYSLERPSSRGTGARRVATRVTMRAQNQVDSQHSLTKIRENDNSEQTGVNRRTENRELVMAVKSDQSRPQRASNALNS